MNERYNRMLISMLSLYIDKHLSDYITTSYNTITHVSTGYARARNAPYL